MMITNKKIALGFRLASLAIAISGVLVTSIRPGVGFVPTVFLYYTTQSNLLAVILFALLSFKTFKSLKTKEIGASFFPRFEMICVVDLLVTLIIYWVLLAPSAFSMGSGRSLFSYSNMAVHLITPLLCFIDYVLFAKSGHLKYRDVFAVAIYPLAYFAFSSLVGLTGYVYSTHSVDGLPVHFPYFFIDYERLGWLVIAYVAVLVVFFLILSHLFYFFDKKVTKKALIK